MIFRHLDIKPLLRKAAIPCAMILLILFAYADVRHHEFLNFDDNKYITENRHVQNGLNLQEIQWAFGFTGTSYWHPLTWISHMLDCRLFGVSPAAHHIVNATIHLLNTLLLCLILSRITGARYKAALVALLFAVHPVNLESVAWVTERKTVLSMFFLMTALYSYVRYAEKGSSRFYLTSLVLYGLGLLCKPSILILPCLLLVLDYWPMRRFRRADTWNSTDPLITDSSEYSPTGVPAFRKSGTVLLFLEKVPFLILSLISSFLSMLSMSKFGMVIHQDLVPVDLRIYNLFVSIVKYLRNAVWPIELSIFYPFPKSIPSAHFLLALACVAGITILTLRWRKVRPWLAAGWMWFLIGLAPASGLIQAGLWPEMANRFMYIPMIGLFWMLVWECDARIRGRHSRILKVLLCCVLLVYFIFLTRVQNLYFSNSYALFTRAAQVTDNNFIAYNNMGHALLSLNRVDEAMKSLLKAIEINPKYEMALNNYGASLSKKGDYIQAESYYIRAISVNPQAPTAYINLGWSQNQRGYPNEAIELLEKALKLDPDNGNGHCIYGNILEEQGKTEDAIRHLQLAIENKPDLIEARVNLVQAYEKTGRYDEALAQYESLIQTKPADKGVTYYRMAGVKSQQNRFEECRRYLDLSLRHGFDVRIPLKSDARFSKFRETELYTQLQENETLNGE